MGVLTSTSIEDKEQGKNLDYCEIQRLANPIMKSGLQDKKAR